jgi:radical SAM protein with 4Fe4S-binding SPASM domain
MDAKISITTKCNAQCKTCPVWQYPGKDMSFETFRIIFDKLNESSRVDKILLNNTGDLYNHPDHISILKYIENNKKKIVAMTTNAELMDYIPKIDSIIISFNGGAKEAYEYTTGLSFDKVKANIEAHYEELRKIPVLEMHCLAWSDTNGSEELIAETWKDFPGRIRVSYKYDNQHKEDKTLPAYAKKSRIPCDYLNVLSIWPNGEIILCAHDFEGVERLGNIVEQSVDEICFNKRRFEKKQEHNNLLFGGICKDCNYNTSAYGKVKYVKEQTAWNY